MNATEKNENDILNDIAKVVTNLDKCLDDLEKLDEDDAHKHTLKKWFAEKKATHEIKRLLHDVNHYEAYDEDELDTTIQNTGLDNETLAYITNYF